jgi:transcriptional regulator with XRE-family HTH domain
MTLRDLLKKWNGGIFRGAPRKFAAALGVSESRVSQMLKHRRAPGEELAGRMARELGITVEAVNALFLSEEKPPQNVGGGESLIADSARLDAIEREVARLSKAVAELVARGSLRRPPSRPRR